MFNCAQAFAVCYLLLGRDLLGRDLLGRDFGRNFGRNYFVVVWQFVCYDKVLFLFHNYKPTCEKIAEKSFGDDLFSDDLVMICDDLFGDDL